MAHEPVPLLRRAVIARCARSIRTRASTRPSTSEWSGDPSSTADAWTVRPTVVIGQDPAAQESVATPHPVGQPGTACRVAGEARLTRAT